LSSQSPPSASAALPPQPASPQRGLVACAEILTVGLPFCVFKLLTGLIAAGAPRLAPVGYALLALGAVDLVLNAINLVALCTLRRRISAVCLAQVVLGRRAARDDLGLAVDVFLSFSLVAVVIGFGLLLRLPRWALSIWNLAVVLNVVGAGVGRLLGAVRAPTTRTA
jgi:hypothetical protein